MTASLINSFNVGTDQSITIFNNQTGASVTLDGKRSMFNMKYTDDLLKGEVIDAGGLPDHRVLGDGLSGRIEVEKQNDNFAQLYAFLEQQYYAGAPQSYFTINEKVNSPIPGGGTSRWQYTNVVFHGYDPGTWQKKQITKATVEVACQQKVPL